MRHIYHAEQWLPYRVGDVFTFFANPENLPPLMPAWQHARIENPILAEPPPYADRLSSSIVAGRGTTMTITFRPVPLIPIRLAWDAEITEFVWDDHFCDVQLRRGPFAFWRHCHRLKADQRHDISGTLVSDHVEYALPFGLLGDVAKAIFVGRQMKYIFDYRHQRTVALMAEVKAMTGS